MVINSCSEILMERLQKPFILLKEDDSWKHEICHRISNAALAVLLPFAGVIDTILLLSALTAHVFTLGRYPVFYDTYTRLTPPALTLFASSFMIAIRVLNPDAELTIDTNWSLSDVVRIKTLQYSKKGSCMVLLASFPVLIAARIADFAVGIFTALACFVYLGNNQTLNNLAFEGLCVMQIIDDTVGLCSAFIGSNS